MPGVKLGDLHDDFNKNKDSFILRERPPPKQINDKPCCE